MPTNPAKLTLFAVVSACAAHRDPALVMRESSPGLYVGHSDTGEILVAASHYDAMNGLAVVDSDLGMQAKPDDSGRLLCKRELRTGTHVPHWVCRYVEEAAHARQYVLNWWQQPAFAPSTPGRGGYVTALGAGTSGRTQER